jgi:hypothetical protein
VVVLSDFFAGAWEQEFEDLAARHDLVAIGLGNPPDGDFPKLGLIPLEDPETGIGLYAPSGFPAFHRDWSRWTGERRDQLEGLCRRAGAACVFPPSSPEGFPLVLSRFFGGRKPVQRVRRRIPGGGFR